jgi:hypothetical protein
MCLHSRDRRASTTRRSAGLALVLAALIVLPAAALAGPCDLYASGGTPCVAAHSTVRALYGGYRGSLYQVRRLDGATRDIGVLSAGGVADAAAQDSFCAGTSCVISIIYDQSGHGNHLTQAPPGGFRGPAANGYDNLAVANAAPITVGGKKAYGVFVSPGTGYRNNRTSSVATGDQPEGMYAIFNGTHYNGGCCFDYGNAETNNLDTGNGHMEALYFGNSNYWGSGAGSGPWVMADLENGLFSGVNVGYNAGDPSVSHRFLTAVLKGTAHRWALRAGNAQSGGLSTYYSGARPNASGYDPMHKEGAIILGIGGDNSVGAQGTFYEGAMTSGYPSDATENAVQANIVAAGYATGGSPPGGTLTPGSALSLRATTSGYTNRYVRHQNGDVVTSVVSSSSSALDKSDATWVVRQGLASSSCLSFESRNYPGYYLRHFNYVLYRQQNDGSAIFAADATFCPQAGKAGSGTSFASYNFPARFLRHYNNVVYIASNGGSNAFDNATSWAADVTWAVSAPWAP